MESTVTIHHVSFFSAPDEQRAGLNGALCQSAILDLPSCYLPDRPTISEETPIRLSVKLLSYICLLAICLCARRSVGEPQ